MLKHETIINLELYVKHLTPNEFFIRPDFAEKYIDNLINLFEQKNLLISQFKIERSNRNAPIAYLLEKYPNRYYQSIKKNSEGKHVKKWADVYCDHIIEPDDPHYHYFFACKLNHLDQHEITGFLSYQLKKIYKNDVIEFCTFLAYLVKKCGVSLSIMTVDSVHEWIKLKLDQTVVKRAMNTV